MEHLYFQGSFLNQGNHQLPNINSSGMNFYIEKATRTFAQFVPSVWDFAFYLSCNGLEQNSDKEQTNIEALNQYGK